MALVALITAAEKIFSFSLVDLKHAQFLRARTYSLHVSMFLQNSAVNSTLVLVANSLQNRK